MIQLLIILIYMTGKIFLYMTVHIYEIILIEIKLSKIKKVMEYCII